MTHGFIILRHARNEVDDLLGKRCFESIREHHPIEKIIIIDDHSVIKKPTYIDVNTEIIHSELQSGVGELTTWYHVYKYKLFDVACVLHDSMALTEPIDFVCNRNKFLWQFEGYHLLGKHNERFFSSLLRGGKSNWDLMLRDMTRWKGCFGVCGIFEWNTLASLHYVFEIFDIDYLQKIKTRTDRMAIERVFGWCCYSIGYNESIFNDIHYYPMAFYETPNEIALNKMNTDVINKVFPIIKIWRGR
jgi:hypothetical protein